MSNSFNLKSTTELLRIVFIDDSDWQKELRNKAKNELLNRGISVEKQKKLHEEVIRNDELELINQRKKEDFSLVKKILIVIFCYEELFHNWWLKKRGYHLKSKRRIQLISFGFILYTLLLCCILFLGYIE